MKLPDSLFVLQIILSCVLYCTTVSAQNQMVIIQKPEPEKPTSLAQVVSEPPKGRWSYFYPYTPERREYGAELGTTYEKKTMYWIGGHLGYHAGRCMFTESSTCQQYIDFVAGAAGREGLTMGYFLPALRWQYMHLPKAISPSWRVLAGLVSIKDRQRDYTVFGYGAEYGGTVAVHPKMHLRASIRVGRADEEWWTQLVFGIDPKLDQWIEDVGNYSWDTLKEGGGLIKDTLLVPVKMIQSDSPKK